MSAFVHGWVRVWLPPIVHSLGTWIIRAGEAIGGPAQLIPVPPHQATIKVEGNGLVGTAQFALSLEMSVYVEPSRVTEVHIPSYWLDKLVAPNEA